MDDERPPMERGGYGVLLRFDETCFDNVGGVSRKRAGAQHQTVHSFHFEVLCDTL